EQSHRSVLSELGASKKELGDLASSTDALTLGLEVEAQKTRFVEHVDRWAPLALTRELMQRALKRFEDQQQSRVLTEVARLLGHITHGRYTEIRRSITDGQLVVVDRDGSPKLPAELSTGTREQLYLAIRLAFIIDYC